MMTVQELAMAAGGEVRGKFVVIPGPGHSPKDRSLSLRPSNGRDGFALTSFAGDDPDACREYVKARIAERAKKGPDRPSLPAIKKPTTVSSKAKIVAEYIYTLSDGTRYLRVQRTDPKGFPQSRWENGRWVPGKPKGPKVPYRLPQLVNAPVGAPVFVVEGEKDAEKLAGLGLVATTASEGAGKWTEDLNRWFAGRVIYILPDNDERGAAHAHQVAEHLSRWAHSVKIVPLPDLPEKEDVSYWLSLGHTAADLLTLCQNSASQSEQHSFVPACSLQHQQFKEAKNIVPGYIIEGLTILAGKPKSCKSWLALDACIAVATGGEALGSQCEQGDVLYAALEDGPKRLQRRMTTLLGNNAPWPERLEFVCTLPRLKDGGVDQVRQWLEKVEDPRLVVIDTLGKVLDRRVKDESLYESDYEVIAKLKELAELFEVAIVLIHHVSKRIADDSLDTVSGTTGLTGAADTVLTIARDGQGCRLEGRGRDLDEDIDKAIEFDRATARWRVQGDTDEVRRSDERTRILACFKEGGPLRGIEIAERADIRPGSVRMMLSRMVRDGQLKREGRGLYAPVTTPPGDSCDDGYNQPVEGEDESEGSCDNSYDSYKQADSPLTDARRTNTRVRVKELSRNDVTDVTGGQAPHKRKFRLLPKPTKRADTDVPARL